MLEVYGDKICEIAPSAEELLGQLNLDLDLWKAQNIYFIMGRTIYPDIASQAGTDALARRWTVVFGLLGDIFQVNIMVPALVNTK